MLEQKQYEPLIEWHGCTLRPKSMSIVDGKPVLDNDTGYMRVISNVGHKGVIATATHQLRCEEGQWQTADIYPDGRIMQLMPSVEEAPRLSSVIPNGHWFTISNGGGEVLAMPATGAIDAVEPPRFSLRSLARAEKIRNHISTLPAANIQPVTRELVMQVVVDAAKFYLESVGHVIDRQQGALQAQDHSMPAFVPAAQAKEGDTPCEALQFACIPDLGTGKLARQLAEVIKRDFDLSVQWVPAPYMRGEIERESLCLNTQRLASRFQAMADAANANNATIADYLSEGLWREDMARADEAALTL